jgi:tripartite ATP-independent transporter DctP family solute receptor
MKLKKLVTTLSIASAFMTCAYAPAASADVWRMASKMPADSSEGRVFQYFADHVEKETNGKIKVTVFPNEQLGKEDAVLEQLQAGIIQIYAEGLPFLKKWEPNLQWIETPFMFESYDHWKRFMDTDLMKSWFESAAKKSGIIPLGDPTAIFRGPYRVMISTKPVNTIDDLNGIKLRMHNSRLHIDVWSQLGTQPITLPWTDVYSSLSKGIVDATNSPVALVEAMRFNEVAPYIIRHDEAWQSIGFMMNQKAFTSLDEETQNEVLKAYNDTSKYSREVMYKAADESIARMEAKGAHFSSLDPAEIIKKVYPYYVEMDKEGKLPKGFLDVVEATR